MRRLFGCFSALLLVAAVLVTLLVRGPGLASLPAPAGLAALIDALDLNVGTGSLPAPQSPAPTQATPAASRPTLPPGPPPAEPTPSPKPPQGTAGLALTLRVLGPVGQPLAAVVDGNAVVLEAQLANTTQQAAAGSVTFSLGSPDGSLNAVGSCPIGAEPGRPAACTVPIAADGWAWHNHQPLERRTVYASLAGHDASAVANIAVRPKPVVLVHGFTSNATTWSAWTGPDGFLAGWSIPGYAVGDGQFGIEPMDTGNLSQPRRPTRSAAENAVTVARYIDAVRQVSGAERVDLVAHSMGGLIARYYVSHLMPAVQRPNLPAVPVVNQLYMIGTPNAGTTCAIPPATLGLYPPATTQLTPGYVQSLFNPQTSDHRAVPFFVLAGDPVQDFAALVCTPLPTDVFVSVASAAGAIPVAAQVLPVRHGEQTRSPAVFAAVVQSLSRDPGGYPIPMPAAPAAAPTDTAGLQVTLVDSGTLSDDRPAIVSVTLDEAEQVSFILYAPDQDVEMSIVDSAGESITREMAPSAPGISTATSDGQDGTPSQGFQLQRPKAGQWQLILTRRAGSKGGGGFYAVAAFLQSDLRLAVDTPAAVGVAGQPVALRALLTGPVAHATVTVRAAIRDARGNAMAEVPLSDDSQAGAGVFSGTWTPGEAGLFTIAVTASGQNLAGHAFQRLGLVAVEAH